MTCTKPASSDPPSSIMIASSQSWNVTSPSKQLLDLLPPLTLLRAQRVAGRGLTRLEAHDPDELTVVGHAVGAAEPALGAGREVLLPAVHVAAQRRLVRAHPLDDLDEHLNLRSFRAPLHREVVHRPTLRRSTPGCHQPDRPGEGDRRDTARRGVPARPVRWR